MVGCQTASSKVYHSYRKGTYNATHGRKHSGERLLVHSGNVRRCTSSLFRGINKTCFLKTAYESLGQVLDLPLPCFIKSRLVLKYDFMNKVAICQFQCFNVNFLILNHRENRKLFIAKQNKMIPLCRFTFNTNSKTEEI